MSDESERVIALSTLTSAPAAACRSSFDTSALALSDMEQANIAYGRFYVRLELAADAFLARESAGEPPAALPPPSQPLAKRRTSRDLMAAMPGEQALGLDTLTAIPMDPPGGAVNRAATFVPRDPNDVPLDVLLPVKPAPPGERPAAQDSVQYVPDYRASTLGFPTLIGWQVAPPPDVPPEPPPVVAPALYLVQRHRLVTYARGFGLGPHVYSFTLLRRAGGDRDQDLEESGTDRQDRFEHLRWAIAVRGVGVRAGRPARDVAESQARQGVGGPRAG